MSEKKILVCVDGSPKSMAAVDYVGNTMSKQKAKITLFHVLMQWPETFLDFNIFSSAQNENLVRESTKDSGKYIDDFMSHAVNNLTQQGFSTDSIEVVLQKLETGYARDIIRKSSDKFDLVVVGRSGFSELGDYVLGSITSKLVESIHDIPLIVVGTHAIERKILVAFDGSDKSKKAVDYVGRFVESKDCEVLLLTIVRPLTSPIMGQDSFFKQKYSRDRLDDNTTKIASLISDMRKKLVSHGFNADLIYETILREKRSRAEGIFSEAKNQGFGTIVAGRRGLTAVSEFVMGRVTRKILFMGSDKTVWIV